MTEPVTVIGSNTVISGNLEGDEDLTIEGRVEGTISLSRTLTIEANGVVHANINVRNAVISGVLVGNVEAEDSVHITEEGRVMGDISAPRVILVDGASFRGSIDMGEFDVERGEFTPRTPREIPRKTPRTAPTPRREVAEPTAKEEPAEAPKAEPETRTPARVRTASSSASKAARAAAAQRAAASAKTDKPQTAKKKSAPAPKVRAVKKSKASRKKR